jgi:hypothetical protein
MSIPHPRSNKWPRYASILDLRLSGLTLQQIADIKGISRERARQIVREARTRLAYRVFKGLPFYHYARDHERDFLLAVEAQRTKSCDPDIDG